MPEPLPACRIHGLPCNVGSSEPYPAVGWPWLLFLRNQPSSMSRAAGSPVLGHHSDHQGLYFPSEPSSAKDQI